jgi:hypothetical protein
MIFATISQVPEELQEEAASVVALYEGFRAGNGTTVEDVREAALHLVEQFGAANRRSGVVENPSLGVLPAPGANVVSQETHERIARALEALVGLFAEAHQLQNPLEEDSEEAGNGSSEGNPDEDNS